MWFESAVVVVALVQQLLFVGTENGRGRTVFKGMPSVCVRHLGLLGLSESSRLHLSSQPKCDASHLVELSHLFEVAQVHTTALLLQGIAQVSQRVTTSCPSRVTLRTSVTSR